MFIAAHFAETVAPSECERSRLSATGAGIAEEATEVDEMFISAPRRILHAAIRIGKSFEVVVECCVL